jgi:hypothetical protein
MRRMAFVFLAAAAMAGCVSSGPAPVEVQLREVDMSKVEDVHACFLAARLVDATFTPLGFMSDSRFLLSLKNLDTGEIFWMRFRYKKKDLIYYQIPSGRYVVSQVVKEDPIFYTDSSGDRIKKMHKVPYALPDVLLSEFQISGGEMIYLGTLTTKDEPNKSYIVYDNDYAESQKALTRAAYIMEEFTVKPYKEPEGGDSADVQE